MALLEIPTEQVSTESKRAGQALDRARKAAYQRIEEGYAAELSVLTDKYPALEREGWPQQEREARSYSAGNDSALIESMATKRGTTAADMANRIITKADNYADLYSVATAKLHNLQDAVENATTVDELEAVVW